MFLSLLSLLLEDSRKIDDLTELHNCIPQLLMFCSLEIHPRPNIATSRAGLIGGGACPRCRWWRTDESFWGRSLGWYPWVWSLCEKALWEIFNDFAGQEGKHYVFTRLKKFAKCVARSEGCGSRNENFGYQIHNHQGEHVIGLNNYFVSRYNKDRA